MLRKIRIIAALLFFVLITLLFLDFSGTLHAWLGWMARIQLIPALLAMNVIVVAALVTLTLLFGRIYCSVICPLGVMQDVISRLRGLSKKNRFAYSSALTWLRRGALVVFVGLLLAGFGSLLEPYSAYGRIASNLLAPLYIWGNNLLASMAERIDSYAFYTLDVWMKSGLTLAVAVVTLVVVGVLAWRHGRTYCNTICPVGTMLGFVSRFSLFKPRLDTSKCNGCKLCARNCKASCIDPVAHTIDYSRCVVCMDCLGKCRQGAITYTAKFSLRGAKMLATAPKGVAVPPAKQVHPTSAVRVDGAAIATGDFGTTASAVCSEATIAASDSSRRTFLAVMGLLAYSTLRAQEKKVDGGLAVIEQKRVPDRVTPLMPPGAVSARNFEAHCTACQLCVAVCPNGVLRPSGKLATMMKPEMSYERGYCRPECTRCSEVCPAGAIRPISEAEKSSTQIGHAVWIKENCVVLTDDVACGNCARHCPTGAIQMVSSDPANAASPQIPVVNEARCIGCGACEHLCPARPFSAICVEGHLAHRTI